MDDLDDFERLGLDELERQAAALGAMVLDRKERHDEEGMRRPGFIPHRWIPGWDGQGWALPPLTRADYLLDPRFAGAQAALEAGFEAHPELEEWQGPAWISATLERHRFLGDYARTMVGLLLPRNYHMTPDQAAWLLPMDELGEEFGRVIDAVGALMDEAISEGPPIPAGWDERQGVTFAN